MAACGTMYGDVLQHLHLAAQHVEAVAREGLVCHLLTYHTGGRSHGGRLEGRAGDRYACLLCGYVPVCITQGSHLHITLSRGTGVPSTHAGVVTSTVMLCHARAGWWSGARLCVGMRDAVRMQPLPIL